MPTPPSLANKPEEKRTDSCLGDLHRVYSTCDRRNQHWEIDSWLDQKPQSDLTVAKKIDIMEMDHKVGQLASRDCFTTTLILASTVDDNGVKTWHLFLPSWVFLTHHHYLLRLLRNKNRNNTEEFTQYAEYQKAIFMLCLAFTIG